MFHSRITPTTTKLFHTPPCQIENENNFKLNKLIKHFLCSSAPCHKSHMKKVQTLPRLCEPLTDLSESLRAGVSVCAVPRSAEERVR